MQVGCSTIASLVLAAFVAVATNNATCKLYLLFTLLPINVWCYYVAGLTRTTINQAITLLHLQHIYSLLPTAA